MFIETETFFNCFYKQKTQIIKVYPIDDAYPVTTMTKSSSINNMFTANKEDKYKDIHEQVSNFLDTPNPSDFDKIKYLRLIQKYKKMLTKADLEEHGGTERIEKMLEPKNRIIRYFFEKIYKQKKEFKRKI